MDFRLLATGFRSAAENMAIDEAVLATCGAGTSGPVVRFYGWTPAAISIGYFQSLEEEVDTVACKKYGVDVVRRMTGGGAVLHEHEITYSIHIPEKLGLVPAGILESYEKICEGVLRGVAHLGISAQFVPLNDIVTTVSGAPQKISGNAQTRKQGIIVQHGTILLKVDIEKMFSLLKVPSEKMKGKLIEDIKQRVTSLSLALKREVGFEEAMAALKQGFQEAFPGTRFIEDALTAEEMAMTKKLVAEKYGSDSWNKKR